MRAPTAIFRPRGEDVAGRPDILLVPLTRDRCLLLLCRIDQLRETRLRDPDLRSVFRTDPDPVHAFEPHAMDDVTDGPLIQAYTDAARNTLTLLGLRHQPFHPRYELTDLDVQIEVGPDDVRWHLIDTRDGRRFLAGPLGRADLAYVALATAAPADIPAFFEWLVNTDVLRALDAFEFGIACGAPEPRQISQHLATSDLLRLLEHDNRTVRERAQALLSNTRKPARAR